MLASYFPKPKNLMMGNWALAQAQALLRSGIDLEVVSPTSWVPRWARLSQGARAFVDCPSVQDWDGLRVHYPRWLVYQVGPPKQWAFGNPTPFLRLGYRSISGWLARRIESRRPDVIYAHHTAIGGYIAWRLARSHGIPYVITDHDFDEISACRIHPSRRRLFAEIVSGSSAMVAVATRMQKEIEDMFGSGKACTVQNGTEPIPAELLSEPRPAGWEGRRVIFSCGSFSKRKGFPSLVDAYAQVARRYRDSMLRIAGDGEERRIVEQRIRHWGIENQVILLGRLTHREVLREMVWSDVFALVGWNEPFATVYSEAAAAGKPIICCTDGGFCDVLQDRVHGLTVPPHDPSATAEALSTLLKREELRVEFGRNAKHLFETRLKWDHNAQRMIPVFENALAMNKTQ